MNNKIISVLLGAIIFLTALNYFESCSSRKDTNTQLKKEMDSLHVRIDELQKITVARRDTVNNINNYQTNIIKEAEGKKNEVAKTNDMDSVVANYFKYRPATKADE